MTALIVLFRLIGLGFIYAVVYGFEHYFPTGIVWIPCMLTIALTVLFNAIVWLHPALSINQQ